MFFRVNRKKKRTCRNTGIRSIMIKNMHYSEGQQEKAGHFLRSKWVYKNECGKGGFWEEALMFKKHTPT